MKVLRKAQAHRHFVLVTLMVWLPILLTSHMPACVQ